MDLAELRRILKGDVRGRPDGPSSATTRGGPSPLFGRAASPLARRRESVASSAAAPASATAAAPLEGAKPETPGKGGRRVSIRPFSAPAPKDEDDAPKSPPQGKTLPGIARVKSATTKRDRETASPSPRSPPEHRATTPAIDARRAGVRGALPASLAKSRIPEAYHVFNEELVTTSSETGDDAVDRRFTDGGRLVVRRFPLSVPTGARKELQYLRAAVERMLADADVVRDEDEAASVAGFPMASWRRRQEVLHSGLHEMARQICVGSVERGVFMSELLETQEALFASVFAGIESLAQTLASAQEGMAHAVEAAEEACRARIEDIEAVMVERELCLVEHIQVLEAAARSGAKPGVSVPPSPTPLAQQPPPPQHATVGQRKPSFIGLSARTGPAGAGTPPGQGVASGRKGSINRRNSLLYFTDAPDQPPPPPVDPEQLPVVQQLRTDRALQLERIQALESQVAEKEGANVRLQAELGDTRDKLATATQTLSQTRQLFAEFEARCVGKQTAQVWRREKVSRFCMFCESGRLQLLAEIQELYHKSTAHRHLRELQYWEIELRLLRGERDRLARLCNPDDISHHPVALHCGKAAVDSAADTRRAPKSASWAGGIVRLCYEAMTGELLRHGDFVPGRVDVPFAQVVHNALLAKYETCAAADAVAVDLLYAVRAHKGSNRWLAMFDEALEGRVRPACLRLRLQLLLAIESVARKPVDRETQYVAHVPLDVGQRIADECLPGLSDDDRAQLAAQIAEASRAVKAGDGVARAARIVALPALVEACSRAFERDVDRLDAVVRTHLVEASDGGYLDFGAAAGVVCRIDPSMSPMDVADTFKAAQRLTIERDPLGAHLAAAIHDDHECIAPDAQHVAHVTAGMVPVESFANALHARGRLYLRPLNLFHLPPRTDLAARAVPDVGGVFDAMARDWAQSFEPLVDAVLFSLGDVGTPDAAAEGAYLAEARAKLAHELSARSSLARAVDLARQVAHLAENALRHIRGLAAEAHGRFLPRELALRRELLAQLSAGAAGAASGAAGPVEDAAAVEADRIRLLSLEQRVRQLLLQH